MSAPVQVGPSPVGGGPVPSLTQHEMSVLQGVADGETYAQIGQRIYLTEKSVSNVATRVMRKLGARTMPHAVWLACRAGLLDGAGREDWPPPLLQVLELVADGRTNADIARILVRSEHTVADQVKEARRRLGARDRAHAAALAVALRLVRVEVPSPTTLAAVDAA